MSPACRDFGIRIEYILLYSPDCDLIERTFERLENWIKRHCHLQDE